VRVAEIGSIADGLNLAFRAFGPPDINPDSYQAGRRLGLFWKLLVRIS